MRIDPIIQEVRDIRHKIEQTYRDDPRMYYNHLKEIGEQRGLKLVRRHPKRLEGDDARKTG